MEYSYSRINTYDNCPRQYQYRYIDKIKPPVELKTIEAFMGNCIHEVLKDFYQNISFQRIPQKSELLDNFKQNWESQWSEDITIMKMKLTPNHYFVTGQKALDQYYERNYPFQNINSLGLEKKFRFTVGKYSFMGIIDRLNLTPEGIYEIHDYKTSGSLPTYPEAEKDLQLALYQLSLRYHFPDANQIRLLWHYLLFDKSWSLELDPEQLQQKEQEIIQKVFAIESDHRFEPKPSGLCPWCNFQDICPTTSHARYLKAAENMSEDDGFEMVGAYARLCHEYKEKKSLLDQVKAEKEELEKQMLEYAKLKEYKVIQGKKWAVQIKEKISYRFPDSKDPARAELEALIDQHQLWKEASMIHSSRLNKLIGQASTPEDIRQELLALSSLEVKASFKWLTPSEDDSSQEEEGEQST